jgi:hypothetical protein
MQHYRAPTRLLDWTEVFHVALYLWNSEHGRDRDLVWPRYFTYSKKNDYFYEYGEILIEDRLDWKFPVALYPPQRDARLSAQRGFFTIHGYDPRPLDEISPTLVVAIDLTRKAITEARDPLAQSGVNEFSLFPDLDGLARHLKAKYEIG